MHISEGVLSLPVIAGGWALCAAGTAAGLKKTPVSRVPRAALVSSVLFLCSLVSVPVGPSSVHLTLLGLAGYLLGWTAVPALFAALLLQALLFQFGGIVSLGANTAIMGCAALSGYGIRLQFRRRYRPLAAFAAGCAAVLSGSALIVAALAASSKDLLSTAAIIMAANLPLAVVEGALTLGIVLALVRIKPDVLEQA
ncbi:MAG: cobalt transporter CbiM [Spirochaetaceae bacterium]|jgi:cobalt/nickel transport system permease protein|nr:cobalt transporter CbiM [Spirochaetaceae bacterium]